MDQEEIAEKLHCPKCNEIMEFHMQTAISNVVTLDKNAEIMDRGKEEIICNDFLRCPNCKFELTLKDVNNFDLLTSCRAYFE